MSLFQILLQEAGQKRKEEESADGPISLPHLSVATDLRRFILLYQYTSWHKLNTYETGKKVTDEQMQHLTLQGDAFHPEWNYTIKPQMN